MAFELPFKPRGAISVQAPDNSVPGQQIPAEIGLTVHEEIKPRALRVELVGEETYYVTVRHTGSKGRMHSRTVQKDEAFASTVHTLAEHPAIIKDMEQKWACSLHLPNDAPATSRGKLVNIRWTLKAVLDVPNRADLSQEKPLQVFCQPAQISTVTGSTAEKSFGEISLFLKTPPSVSAGSALKGELSLQTKEKLNIRGIRIELVRYEAAGSRNADEVVSTARVSGEAAFSQYESPSYQFSLEIPPEIPPTAICQHSSLRWKVRAVLDRKMKTDFNVEQEVLVYNAPKV